MLCGGAAGVLHPLPGVIDEFGDDATRETAAVGDDATAVVVAVSDDGDDAVHAADSTPAVGDDGDDAVHAAGPFGSSSMPPAPSI
jgi:hypothetical protein